MLLRTVLLASSLLAGCLEHHPRLNEIQVLGTHNSYHIQPRPALMGAIASLEPELARTLEYTHLPLGEQLEHGARQFEFYVYADPAGGHYARVNDARTDQRRIAELVAAGYLVRTRADIDTIEARSGDTALQAAAFASGAQYVSTDYLVPNPLFGTARSTRRRGVSA